MAISGPIGLSTLAINNKKSETGFRMSFSNVIKYHDRQAQFTLK